jgi:hypothetical protein
MSPTPAWKQGRRRVALLITGLLGACYAPLDEELGAAGSAGSDLPWPDLGPGSFSPPVAALQLLLQGRDKQAPATGKYDETTRLAVRALQREHGIAESDVVNAATWTALIGEEAFTGDADPRAKAARYLFGKLGLEPTSEAIETVQQCRALEMTGTLDLPTWRSLLASQAPCPAGGPIPADLPGLVAAVLAAHESGRIVLNPSDGASGDSRASPLQNVRDAASGNCWTSSRAHGGARQVAIAPAMLQGMLCMADRVGPYRVNFMCGGRHTSAGSAHYAGNAVDMPRVFGLTAACTDCGASQPLDEGDHAHCGRWPAGTIAAAQQ